MTDNIIGQLGRKLKQTRLSKALKLYEVAAEAHVSKGLLSRIENGRTIPSLPVLISIVHALKEEVGTFFHDIYRMQEKPYLLFKKDEYNEFEKEGTKGFKYHHILTRTISTITVETVLLILEPGAEREMITTDAIEFKYMISGSALYHIGNEAVMLEEGNSLYFNGKTPHAPSNPSAMPCTMLVVYFFFNDELTS
ncbi:XRE family transcriptional regulator [Imperialibacter roseus]|uniref:XRE family transcriptional regulator n=1 Tax=Imperialibacter roseus TaxID=1324217 RepID=A0ABZ0IP62_9BACT|nr:XRE family transcriptional regulator [Imperialibacter roseus]WOK05511.1 XRE family transcriptional regulator [Imperialibacter roseus]